VFEFSTRDKGCPAAVRSSELTVVALGSSQFRQFARAEPSHDGQLPKPTDCTRS